jgi:hypothetical protein
MQTKLVSAVTQSTLKISIISGLSLLCIALHTTVIAGPLNNHYEQRGVVDAASIIQKTITIRGTLYLLITTGEQQSQYVRSRENRADETIKFHRFRAGQKVRVHYRKESDGRYITRLVLLPNTAFVGGD